MSVERIIASRSSRSIPLDARVEEFFREARVSRRVDGVFASRSRVTTSTIARAIEKDFARKVDDCTRK